MTVATLTAVSGTGTLGSFLGKGRGRVAIASVTATKVMNEVFAHEGAQGENTGSAKAGMALAKDLEKVFKDKLKPPQSAKKMAEAYNKYAKTVMAAAGKPILTGAEVKLLEATILQAIAMPAGGTPIKFAQAWANGVQTFWSAPPVQFTFGPYIGPVMVTMAAPLIQPLVVVLLNLPGATPASSGKRLAAALMAGTMTTTVQMVAPQLPPIVATLK